MDSKNRRVPMVVRWSGGSQQCLALRLWVQVFPDFDEAHPGVNGCQGAEEKSHSFYTYNDGRFSLMKEFDERPSYPRKDSGIKPPPGEVSPTLRSHRPVASKEVRR